jgi:hypothetical protein
MGMLPACSEALFNHLCQAGLLPFPWLARCSAVSQQWRGDLANALPTLRDLDFGGHAQRVTGADVLRSLTRVSASNLRVVDLQDLRRVDAANMEEILRVMGASFPDTTILQGKCVELRVRGQDGLTTTYRLKENTRLQELMDAFCIAAECKMDDIHFLFDGAWLRDNQTPRELNMEDGDEIGTLPRSRGGGA